MEVSPPLYSQFMGVQEENIVRFITDGEEDSRKTRIASINCYKLNTNKNFFHGIKVGAIMFTWIKKYQQECVFRR